MLTLNSDVVTLNGGTKVELTFSWWQHTHSDGSDIFDRALKGETLKWNTQFNVNGLGSK